MPSGRFTAKLRNSESVVWMESLVAFSIAFRSVSRAPEIRNAGRCEALLGRPTGNQL